LLSRQRHSAIDIEDNSGIGVKVAIKLMIRINAGINHLRMGEIKRTPSSVTRNTEFDPSKSNRK
jgi:hypothetical protein